MDFLQSNVTTNGTVTASSFQFSTLGWYLNVLLGLPTNSYVIWLIVSGTGNGVASEFFSLNLSVSEIFLCLQSLLYLLNTPYTELWMFVRFLSGLALTSRPLFQCLICVERYVAVVHPVTFLKYKPLRYKVICCIVTWIIILVTCVFSCFSETPLFYYSLMCFCFCQGLLVFSIQLFCCLAVLRALKQSGPGERGREREEENHMKRKAFNIILIITIAIVFTYFVFMFVIFSFLLTYKFNEIFWSVGHVCFVLGGLAQPFLHLHRTGNLPFCKGP